jgi:hypothetical protein
LYNMPRAQYLISDFKIRTKETTTRTLSNAIGHFIWILYEDFMSVLPGTPVYD